MGKAAKFKQLRKIANSLPAIQTRQKVYEKIQGKYIEGVDKDKDGNSIEPDRIYRREKLENVSLNHYKKMKQNYNKAGMGAVAV